MIKFLKAINKLIICNLMEDEVITEIFTNASIDVFKINFIKVKID